MERCVLVSLSHTHCGIVSRTETIMDYCIDSKELGQGQMVLESLSLDLDHWNHWDQSGDKEGETFYGLHFFSLCLSAD